jgi:predicted TIM-barrel fold metal-dependent hydrolase
VIIDSHAHVHPNPEGLGEKFNASADTFLKEFDASPLDKIVLLPIEPFIPNGFVQEVAAQRHGQIYCYGSADPTKGDEAIEGFDDLAASGSIVGLKLHPRRQGFGLEALPVVTRLAERAVAHDLPVLIDAFPYGKGALGDCSLELIECISESVPKAHIIVAHMGGVRILDALILARTSYTIYLDLSLIYAVYRGSHIEQDIFYAIRRIGPDRCLYGSDYPDVGMTQSYQDMRDALDAHGFDDNEREQIFGRTAAGILAVD